MKSVDKITKNQTLPEKVFGFVSQALLVANSVDDVYRVVLGVCKITDQWCTETGNSRTLGKRVAYVMSAVNGTYGLPVPHKVLAPLLASLFGIETDYVRIARNSQRFKFTGAELNVQLFNPIIRFVLICYDRLSFRVVKRKDLQSLSMQEKRIYRRAFNEEFIIAMVKAVQEGLKLTDERVNDILQNADWLPHNFNEGGVERMRNLKQKR